MPDFVEHQHRLAAAMEQAGGWPARSPWIRQAVAALPRHAFAPDRLWSWDGHAYQAVDRTTEPERWAGEVYGNPYEAAITQLSDGVPTSSLSAQNVVVDMLDSLLLDEGHHVLELGAGTGWNAALLAWRTGTQVTSVETDESLAVPARQRLRASGAAVTVEVGDGTAGWPDGTRYHRTISTFAVEHVPWAWVQQTVPGGRIVTPWGRLGHVALTVADDGRSATGWMQGLAMFMSARGTAPARRHREVRDGVPPAGQRPFQRDLAPLRDDWNLKFALRVAVPDLYVTTAVDEDGLNAWLHDNTASWATISAIGGGRTIVTQGGPRHLADEVEQAWDQWLATDTPTPYDYGMTVTPKGQFIWCKDPATGPRWTRGRTNLVAQPS
ncbi:methyltransferase domain-containing protein [Streptomyces sp. H10-C2]|uniref:methyltransferase domain-containing protein n=1 Tax=unclassified Streptomyces TaxID=2593676 RepID=UPI0024BB89BF|nr:MULTISPECIES: methyltransferase domain-containing protein [unclassified Streptomyces]MDJ0342832.1 methyltransferase domain-containing protein [Streptomyces sp. PH10-H1]MDJ0372510.1 methyltransferase domain-containing protein [Streptomyces sp. H10-C2]